MKSIVLLAIGILLILSSCNEESVTSTVSKNDWIRFKRGNIEVLVDGTQISESNGKSSSSKGSHQFSLWVYGCTSDSTIAAVSPPNFELSSCSNPTNPPFVSSSNYIAGVADINSSRLLSLTGLRSNSSYPPFSGSTKSSSSLKIKVSNAKYTDYTDSVVVFYSGNQMEEISLVLSDYSSSSESGTGSTSYSDSFTPSGKYTPDDYIRITLYR